MTVTAATRPVKKLSMLIVDDFEGLGESFQGIFTRFWRVQQVLTYDAAQRALEGVCWDAVIIDVGLGDPTRTGLDLLAWGKAQCPNTCFLILTADGRQETILQASQLGATYLRKPAEMVLLRAWVQSVRTRTPSRMPPAFPSLSRTGQRDGIMRRFRRKQRKKPKK